MSASNFDVVIVGAGAAGTAAAIGLARAGFRVAVVEAAVFPGAENWSGCVYFCENLAHPDILGPGGVEALAWERRLVERGFFATDGHGLLGMTYRDPEAFRHCYTVLRPIYDQHLARMAEQHGAVLLRDTTAESLIREGGRVIGVATQRGPLYADLVFLAEGDASHLVTREGYERFADRREKPKFLQGIKQVFEMPPEAIERIFDVGPDEGIAYEMLLRNGTLRGKPVHLNMGGFVYANRQSLSVGLVLPADNLHEHFGGDPNLLLEWFVNLPALRPWLEHGQRGVFGAKIIRGGGARDIPTLIDDGLAVGGAASAIGIDFPYPNFTGPATAMGLLLAQAASRIRAEGGRFSREDLQRHYLRPLQQTHYWKDVEFLRRWPAYVKRTQVFFDRNLDLVLGTAYVWTRPRRWFLTKWVNWLRVVREVAGPGHWRLMRDDLRQLTGALRLREIVSFPSIGGLLIDGTFNALRDLFGRPRGNLPPAGKIRLRYTVAGGYEPVELPATVLGRWFTRFAPVLSSAARTVYNNDDVPLAKKLPATTELLLRQMNLLDALAGLGLALAAGASGVLLAGWDRVARVFRRKPGQKALYPRYVEAVRQTTDLTPAVTPARQNWEAQLARLAYQTSKTSHIQIHWPRSLPDKDKVAQAGLWHVCPAHVYEARVSPQGQLQVVVNYENCIKCETCWRTSDLVDWARDGRHSFVYAVSSPAAAPLLDAVGGPDPLRPALPYVLDHWEPTAYELIDHLRAVPLSLQPPEAAEIAELLSILDKLGRKLEEFDAALGREPRTVDRSRAEFLEMLTRYAQQLAARFLEVLRGGRLAQHRHPALVTLFPRLLELATALATRAEERARRTWDQHFAWAAADGRQLRQHHIAGLRRFLGVLREHGQGQAGQREPARAWLRAEEEQAATAEQLAGWRRRLDDAFGLSGWRALEHGEPLTEAQDTLLRELLGQVPPPDPADLGRTLHPPSRKALLAELGRRDPSLAYRAACHLWARDLTLLAAASPELARAAGRWARGEEWACFAAIEGVPTPESGWKGEALFVPALGSRTLLLLLGDRLHVVPAVAAGLRVEPLATLGLRGAGLARIRLDNFTPAEAGTAVDPHRLLRLASVLSAADLTSIAAGMAEQLCQRAIAHATSRVQFPGLFHDEQSRDPIGKFGAVKKMIAEMAARRYLLETLDHAVSPTDFSAQSVDRASLVKALAAECLGTAPASLAYNAGQVFGGTGYSEDDILSKYYRDAAAWRYLGPGNVTAYRRHGEQLLRQWQADGQRLAGLPDEGLLFDDLAQRQALQAELDEVRVLRSRLRALVGAARDGPAPAEVADQARFAELLARQDAHLLASKALLLRTHARLEQGLDTEVETALLRVWLAEAARSLEEFESGLRRAADPAVRRHDHPVVDPGAGPPVTAYADYLAAPCPYDSGDFLHAPVDLTQPRLVPELIEADPKLAECDRQIRELFVEHFGGPRAGGLPYERYVERQHRPDAEDLEFLRRHGFFRMPIPRELGGEGRPKIDYYLLTTNAKRLADVAVSLTIQVNTSLGTTPILLARDKDLPKAQKEAEAFASDPALPRDVQTRLEKLLALFSAPDPRRIEQGYRELHQRLQEAVFSRGALRVLAFRFAQAWEQAGRAGLDYDLETMHARLKEALTHWQDACGRAADYRDELARRREACDLYLRWIAAGQISAFALTEPSAGSDTARVATRARPHSVPVEHEPDGVLHFTPEGGNEVRYVLDARRMEFRPDGAFYRWSDTAEPARIRFDEYDYETDDPGRLRHYDHGGRRVRFTDIAQLRERDGRLWYDYWELTGAKMWITNGRMCGVMALYAKTEEGVTGFLVDRHAEGLVVGKDEAKMGQLGSPTNELSLQSVRVPRENVLGLEGRGQVNALETLNVGRAGLAMTAMAQMKGLIEQSRAFARAEYGDIPDWAAWRLRQMEEERFIAEAVAWEVIGRFEHPQTKSVRMESAVSKMLVSELLHHVIELAEDVYGLTGQTQFALVEKRKRDARILNIYEGTNEIQRFFILKDLAGEVAPKWKTAGSHREATSGGREALELEGLKAEVRQRVQAALDVFGQQLWQNPNLQANCFLLAEAAAWLKAADSTLGRLAWLDRRNQEDEAAEPPPQLAVARRALARCQSEVRDRLRGFDEELSHLRRGHYAPEVRAASLLFDRIAEAPATPPLASHITRPLSVLVVVEPSVETLPHPRVADGRLLEPYRALSGSDRAALETALRLRDQAGVPVSIHVAAVGTRATVPVLREVLGLGVDRARLVVAETDAVRTDIAASALATVLADGPTYDLVLGGAGAGDAEEGLLARLTAVALGGTDAGTANLLAVRQSDGGADVVLIGADGRRRVRPLPAAVNVEAGLSLRPFDVAGYLAGLSRPVECERWPRQVSPRPALLAEAVEAENGQARPAAEESAGSLTPQGAARQVMTALGLADSERGPTSAYDGAIDNVGQPPSLGGVLAVVAAEADGRLQPTAADVLDAARVLARASAAEVTALLVTGQAEAIQRHTLGQLVALGSAQVVVLALPEGNTEPGLRGRCLREALSGRLAEEAPRAVVGEAWAESAFLALGHGSQGPTNQFFRVRRLAGQGGEVLVETARAQGKLRVRQGLTLAAGQTCWLTLAPGAVVGAAAADAPAPSVRVRCWVPRFDALYASHEFQRLLAELKEETGLVRLSDADFIIDVGFGVGNRDGYEAVIAPLEEALRALGVHGLAVGGSRKVTEELHVLPVDRQIGQSGVSVNPQILLAIGVSGAPQHLNYIGPRAAILAFNRDPEAPLMTLNQRQPRPRVFPIVGDLFETVPAFVAALRQAQPAGPNRVAEPEPAATR